MTGYGRCFAAWRDDAGPLWLTGLALVVAALVFLGEGIGLALSYGQPVSALLPQ